MPKKKVAKIHPDDLPFLDGPGRELLEKLYTLTLDEVLAETDKAAEEISKGAQRITRWAAARELSAWRERYKGGEKKAITESLYLCAINDLPLPKWLAYSYLAAWRKVHHFEAGSWDDVFGRPHKKGAHLESLKDRRLKMLRVYHRIQEIRRMNPETAIDEALFERVGQELALGRSVTDELYYKAKRILSDPPVLVKALLEDFKKAKN